MASLFEENESSTEKY